MTVYHLQSIFVHFSPCLFGFEQTVPVSFSQPLHVSLALLSRYLLLHSLISLKLKLTSQLEGNRKGHHHIHASSHGTPILDALHSSCRDQRFSISWLSCASKFQAFSTTPRCPQCPFLLAPTFTPAKAKPSLNFWDRLSPRSAGTSPFSSTQS